MDLFRNAKAVRLKGHHQKYLIASEDEENVTQDRHGSSKSARWTVEFSPENDNIIRLKSCYNKYLTASNHPFLLGMTGHKVLQTLPGRVGSSEEWDPVRAGSQVQLKTRYGQFLRANGGLPPWRNSVTHDIPYRTSTQEWILWDVDVVEINVLYSPAAVPKPPVVVEDAAVDSNHFDSDARTRSASVSIASAPFYKQHMIDFPTSSPPRTEARTVYYHVVDEDGHVDDSTIGYALPFNGDEVDELIQKLEEETGLTNISVLSRSSFNQKLCPLGSQLPLNRVDIRVIVVPSSFDGKILI